MAVHLPLMGAVNARLGGGGGGSTVTFASATDMEAATATGIAVTPEMLIRDPAVSKAWARILSGGTIDKSMNVSSVVNVGTGLNRVNLTTGFSAATQTFVFGTDTGVVATATNSATQGRYTLMNANGTATAQTATNFQARTIRMDTGADQNEAFYFIGIGDRA